jgi:hypothetical protein
MLQPPNGAARARILLAAAGLALGLGCAAPAAAQALGDRYWLEASFYRPSIDTAVQVSRPSQPGTSVDAESELGLDDTDNLPAVYAGARLGERWVINGEYYALDRDATRTLSRDFVFDGETFTTNGQTRSEVHSDVYRLTVGYGFYRTDRAEIGASVGLHATNFDISVNGQVQGPGGGAVTTDRRGHDFLAPLPTVGLYGTYEIGPRWTLNGRVDYLSMTVGDYSGGVTNLQASAAWRWTDNIALGAAWRYVAYDLEVKKTSYTTNIDYNFNGPSVFARFSFR